MWREFSDSFPTLKEFWWAKEQLRSFYKALDKAEGEKILGRVLIACRTSEDAEMMRWGRTLSRWKPYLLNYFEHLELEQKTRRSSRGSFILSFQPRTWLICPTTTST